MNISMIIGSPKTGNSCSVTLLKQLEADLKKMAVQTQAAAPAFSTYQINRQPLSAPDIAEIVRSDIIVVAFPLYVDGIPSHMLSALYQLEDAFTKETLAKKPIFYGIINNGFSEGFQNQFAAQMLEMFCVRAQILFGQVFTTGAGEMIRSCIEANIPFGKGNLAFLQDNWTQFVTHIYHKETAPAIFCSPKMPAFLFRLMGNYGFWRPAAKKNGIGRKALNTKRVYKEGC